MPHDIDELSKTLSRMRLEVLIFSSSYVREDEEAAMERRDGTGLLGAMLVAGEMMKKYEGQYGGRIEIRPEGAEPDSEADLVVFWKSEEYGYWYINKFPTT